MEKLFLTVFNMGINSGYLVLAVAVVRFLLKKAPKNIICLLWIATGLRLACPFRIETVFSLLPEQTDTFIYKAYNEVLPEDNSALPGVLNMPETDIKPSDTPRITLQKTALESKNPGYKIISAATWIWLTGACIMFVYMAYGWYCIKKKTATAVPSESEGIRFYQCEHISSPFLFGLAVPKIYVPFSVNGEELSYILKHEHAHKSRHDHLSKSVGYLILSVYWFQPLVWAAYIMFCRDIEMACDERVVKEIGENCKKAYSQALLSCSASHQASLAYPVAFRETGVKDRVKNILNYKKPNLRIVITAAAACMIVAACFATDAKSQKITKPELKQELGNIQASTQKKQQNTIVKNVTRWAEAFCNKDSKVIYTMLDNSGRKALSDQDMLTGKHFSGWSSPWPWNVEASAGKPDYRIISIHETSAVILYYAWTSDPHVTVWHQIINYRYPGKKEKFLINNVSKINFLDNIHTAEQFYTAYPDGEIDNTRMDYKYGNSAGEALNSNTTPGNYEILSNPDTAAVFLLNIQDNPSIVKTDVSDKDGETIVTFTFLEDGSSASVKMVQLSGGRGIWVPQTN